MANVAERENPVPTDYQLEIIRCIVDDKVEKIPYNKPQKVLNIVNPDTSESLEDALRALENEYNILSFVPARGKSHYDVVDPGAARELYDKYLKD